MERTKNSQRKIEKISCYICKKDFPKYTVLERHASADHGKCAYKCLACKKSFRRKKHYMAHLLSVSHKKKSKIQKKQQPQPQQQSEEDLPSTSRAALELLNEAHEQPQPQQQKQSEVTTETVKQRQQLLEQLEYLRKLQLQQPQIRSMMVEQQPQLLHEQSMLLQLQQRLQSQLQRPQADNRELLTPLSSQLTQNQEELAAVQNEELPDQPQEQRDVLCMTSSPPRVLSVYDSLDDNVGNIREILEHQPSTSNHSWDNEKVELLQQLQQQQAEIAQLRTQNTQVLQQLQKSTAEMHMYSSAQPFYQAAPDRIGPQNATNAPLPMDYLSTGQSNPAALEFMSTTPPPSATTPSTPPLTTDEAPFAWLENFIFQSSVP